MRINIAKMATPESETALRDASTRLATDELSEADREALAGCIVWYDHPADSHALLTIVRRD